MSDDERTRTSLGAGEASEILRTQLVVVVDGVARVHDLPPHGAVVIGRGSDAEVTVKHASVSRRHAELVMSPREIGLRDLGSHNGTRVAGRRVEGTVTVRAGDAIELGDVTAMLQRSGGGARAGAARLLTDVTAHAEVPTPEGVVAGAWLRRAWPMLERIARGSIAVLLLGETGVGKDVLARAIHAASPRAAGPLVSLNCAALPATLLESELFGHAKGAFTGADVAKKGLIEAADGGTLFLDEIGDVPLALQAKLLRVVEDGQILRVGALESRAVNVRYVAATHRDLEREVEAGTFRRDLFYRLNAFTLRVPPLRERRDEIPALAARFLEAFGSPAIAADAMAALQAHPWPGNVRELRNAVERASLLAGGEAVRAEHLPEPLHGAPAPEPPRGSTATELGLSATEQADRARIVAALASCGHNQTRAAELLGISRRTLVSRLHRYAIPRPRD